MNDKLTENNETPEVGANPIFTIRERQKDETDEIKILSDQTADSVAMNGSEIELEITKDSYDRNINCLLYTSPSPRDRSLSRMPSSA